MSQQAHKGLKGITVDKTLSFQENQQFEIHYMDDTQEKVTVAVDYAKLLKTAGGVSYVSFQKEAYEQGEGVFYVLRHGLMQLEVHAGNLLKEGLASHCFVTVQVLEPERYEPCMDDMCEHEDQYTKTLENGLSHCEGCPNRRRWRLEGAETPFTAAGRFEQFSTIVRMALKGEIDMGGVMAPIINDPDVQWLVEQHWALDNYLMPSSPLNVGDGNVLFTVPLSNADWLIGKPN